MSKLDMLLAAVLVGVLVLLAGVGVWFLVHTVRLLAVGLVYVFLAASGV